MHWRRVRGGGRVSLGGVVEDSDDTRSKCGVRCGGDGCNPYLGSGWVDKIVVSRPDRGLMVDVLVSVGDCLIDGGDRPFSVGEGLNSILGMVVCVRVVEGGDGSHPVPCRYPVSCSVCGGDEEDRSHVTWCRACKGHRPVRLEACVLGDNSGGVEI